MREAFPQEFKGKQAPPKRKVGVTQNMPDNQVKKGSKKVVKLTKGQVEAAKRMGVDLKDYARQVADLANNEEE